MEFSVFLFDKEEGRDELTFGWPNTAGGQIFLQEVVKFLLFGCSEVVSLTVDFVISLEEFNCMVPWSSWREFVEHFFGEYILILMICFGNDFFKCFGLFLFSSCNSYVSGEVPEVFMVDHE